MGAIRSLFGRIVFALGITRTLGLLITAALSLGFLVGVPFLDLLELKAYDLRVVATAPQSAPRHVAVVAIDDRSLAELGRWPWRRQTLAQMVDRIAQAGGTTLAMGVLFGEPENEALVGEINALPSPALTPAARALLQASLSTDAQLAQAIGAHGRVVLPVALVEAPPEPGAAQAGLPPIAGLDALPVRVVVEGAEHRLSWDGPMPNTAVENIDSLQSRARAVGHINTRPDTDGTVRRLMLAQPWQDRWVASADLLAAAVRSGAAQVDLFVDRFGIAGMGFGSRRIDTDEQATAFIRYYGPAGTVPTVSAADLLGGQADLSLLRDRIVVIGPTATGIDTPSPSPFDSRLSGIEVRATAIENLIEGSTLMRPRWLRLVELGLLLGLGVALSFVLPRIGVVPGAAIGAGLLAALAYGSVAMFERNLVFEFSYPATLVAALFLLAAAQRYLRTAREKREIKAAFQYYVPSKVVDEITRDISKLQLGGVKRELSVLFSDIRGFTTMAEGMAPETLVELLTTYLTQMTNKVFLHDGMLDKYIGDAVMAVYGAPIHRQDHAVLACRTALDMMAALRELQAHWKATGTPSMNIGIGINTGPMIVGNMGSENRFDYTVIGDAVNLGSRIEGMNKDFGTNILISDTTYAAVRDAFPNLRQVEFSGIRGRTGRVGLYELMPPSSYPGLDWVPEYERAYGLLLAGQQQAAVPIFEELQRTVNDPVSAYHLRQIRGLSKADGGH